MYLFYRYHHTVTPYLSLESVGDGIVAITSPSILAYAATHKIDSFFIYLVKRMNKFAVAVGSTFVVGSRCEL